MQKGVTVDDDDRCMSSLRTLERDGENRCVSERNNRKAVKFLYTYCGNEAGASHLSEEPELAADLSKSWFNVQFNYIPYLQRQQILCLLKRL